MKTIRNLVTECNTAGFGAADWNNLISIFYLNIVLLLLYGIPLNLDLCHLKNDALNCLQNTDWKIMFSFIPYLTYFILYTLSVHVVYTNTRSSTYWKLNSEGKIEASQLPSDLSSVSKEKEIIVEGDEAFNIITSTVRFGSTWSKQDNDRFCLDCQPVDQGPTVVENNETSEKPKNATGESVKSGTTVKIKLMKADRKSDVSEADDYLDCGKPANFTIYDHLVGIANRHKHPHAPEPQVSLIFHKNKGTKKHEIDIAALERRLLKAKREKPKSVQLYNQIGNFWRVKGDTQKSIECFRRALAVSPNNAEVLLNLGRVLFNLQYLDDAIYLTRRSLEVQPPDKNAWQQYFTLGEILKAYGHYQDAALHLQHALELKPEFEPALNALRDMESAPAHAIHVYTVLIIVCLVLGVLLVILSSVDAELEESQEMKSQVRHFNRAMAMRSLKMGISSRSQLRARRN